MRILALDVSSKSSGWAVLDDGLPLKDGYGTICPSKKLSEGARLLYFQNEVVRLITHYQPTEVIAEDIFRGPSTLVFKILSTYRGVALKTVFEHTGKEARSMLAVTARALVGVGCSKDEAFEGIIKKYKLKGNWDYVKHNDIIDAFCLGFALIELLNGKSITPRPKKKRKRKTRKTSKPRKTK